MARSSTRRGRIDNRALLQRRRKLLPSKLGPAPTKGINIFALLGQLLLSVVLLIGVVVLGISIAGFSAYTNLANSLKPRLEAIGKRDTFETSRIYDRNGTLLYEFLGSGKRTHVPLKDISPLLREATISIEDKTFYDNAGFDPRGIGIALFRNLSSGGIAGGGSTITQQTVKKAVLSEEERTVENQYWRKVKEVILAQELTQQYGKDEILELYLNEIYYGNLSYGIEAASQSYFGVHARDLSVGQAALLAGLPQLPSAYDPITNNYLDGDILPGIELGPGWYRNDYPLPEGLTPPKRRQIAVMSQLVDEKYISEAEGRASIAADLRFAPQERPLNAPHFVFWVRKQLEAKYGDQLANEGLSIYTTLDLNMQTMVQEQAKARIDELRERNIYNAAVVVMQPNTGQVLAMLGSIDYNQTQASQTPGQPGNVLDGEVNVALRERQPGSALKPFTYLSALERGATPATVWWDVPTEFSGGNSQAYAPLNYNAKWNGPLRMRTALANSLNMPAVKALKFAGIENTLDLLHRAGINGLQRGRDYYGLSLTLGGGEVTPLDLTTAYNTLASGGRYFPPIGVLKVVNTRGEVLEQYTPPTISANQASFDPQKVAKPIVAGEQVINPDHVAIIANMMSDNAARAPVFTLDSKLKLSRPAAVKTGTTNDWRDAWAAGFTPYLTIGVWTGNNNNEPTAKVESVTSGGVIWHNIMEAVFADPRFQRLLAEPANGKLAVDFTLPSDLTRKPICKLPGPYNYYAEEVFSPDMFKGQNSALATATPLKGLTNGIDCDVYQQIQVANLGGSSVVSISVDQADGALAEQKNVCRVVDGVQIPPELISTVSVWKTPPPDPDEKISYTWQGMSGSTNDLPACTSDVIAAIAPPGSIRMPDLRGFGENQAKEQLAALGFNMRTVFVQYQDRSILNSDYDKYSPYAVVSSIPSAGKWILPGETIYLGVRAPDAAPAEPTPAPFVPAPAPDAPPAIPGLPPGPPVPTAPPG